MISQEQSAALGYSSGYAGEKMVPLSDVMLPPHGTGGGRKEGRGQGIFIYQRAVNTSGQIHYSAAIVKGGGGEGGMDGGVGVDFFIPVVFCSPFSVSLSLSSSLSVLCPGACLA